MGSVGIAVSIFVAWLFAICMALPVVLSRVKMKKLTRERTKVKLNSLVGTISEFDSRLQIVRAHAIDYLNSLGSDGARQMSEIQSLLVKIQVVADQAQNLLETESFGNIKLAERIMDGQEPIILEDSGVGNPSNWEFRLKNDWSKEIEALLQALGANVANASKSAKNIGIPSFGRQFKRETIHDLKEAGIDIMALRDKIKQ